MVAKKKIIEHDIGICSCDNAERPWKEHIQHMKDAHGYNKDTNVTGKMTMHMDGDDWFSSVYEYDGTVPFSRSSLNKRRKGERW